MLPAILGVIRGVAKGGKILRKVHKGKRGAPRPKKKNKIANISKKATKINTKQKQNPVETKSDNLSILQNITTLSTNIVDTQGKIANRTVNNKNTFPMTSYQIKELKQKEIEQKSDQKDIEDGQKETNVLLKTLINKISNIGSKGVTKGKTVITQGVQKAKEIGTTIAKKGKKSGLLSKLLIGAVIALVYWWKEATSHKYGIVGWLIEKIINTTKVLWELGKAIFDKIDWTAMKEKFVKFFTEENFISKYFDETVWPYFRDGKALQDLISGAKWFANIVDKVYTELFGQWWTSGKKWVKSAMDTILDWWDEVQKYGGLPKWLYFQVFNMMPETVQEYMSAPQVMKSDLGVTAKEKTAAINADIKKHNKTMRENSPKYKKWKKDREIYEKKINEKYPNWWNPNHILHRASAMKSYDFTHKKPVVEQLKELKASDIIQMTIEGKSHSNYSKYSDILNKYQLNKYVTNPKNNDIYKTYAGVQYNSKNVDTNYVKQEDLNIFKPDVIASNNLIYKNNTKNLGYSSLTTPLVHNTNINTLDKRNAQNTQNVDIVKNYTAINKAKNVSKETKDNSDILASGLVGVNKKVTALEKKLQDDISGSLLDSFTLDNKQILEKLQ